MLEECRNFCFSFHLIAKRLKKTFGSKHHLNDGIPNLNLLSEHFVLYFFCFSCVVESIAANCVIPTTSADKYIKGVLNLSGKGMDCAMLYLFALCCLCYACFYCTEYFRL